MAEKVDAQTRTKATPSYDTNIPLLASQSDARQFLAQFGLDTDRLGVELGSAGSNARVDRTIRALEITSPGTVERMFPADLTDKNGKKVPQAQQVKDLDTLIAGQMQTLLVNPAIGMAQLGDTMSRMIQPALKAGLMGDPIENMPDYVPFYEVVLQRAPATPWAEAVSGRDKIEYAAPIERTPAYGMSPEGSPEALEVSSSLTEIDPYFLYTWAYRINLWEWATIPIHHMRIKQTHLLQELAMAWDADLIVEFDAVVPDGSLYSSHATHTGNVANTADAVTATEFKAAGRYLRHSDSTSGTLHHGRPGFALCDPLAVDDIQNWGDDEWTKEEVSEANKGGFRQTYEDLRVGKQVDRFTLLEMPLQHDRNRRKVRFFAQPKQVGWWVPVTFMGKNFGVKLDTLKNGDPDWRGMTEGRTRHSKEPPGFSFSISAWQCGGFAIGNKFMTSKLNDTA